MWICCSLYILFYLSVSIVIRFIFLSLQIVKFCSRLCRWQFAESINTYIKYRNNITTVSDPCTSNEWVLSKCWNWQKTRNVLHARVHIFCRYFNFSNNVFEVFSARWKFIHESWDIGTHHCSAWIHMCVVTAKCWLIHFVCSLSHAHAQQKAKAAIHLSCSLSFTSWIESNTSAGLSQVTFSQCRAKNRFCIVNKMRDMPCIPLRYIHYQHYHPQKPQNAIVRMLFNALCLKLYFSLLLETFRKC